MSSNERYLPVLNAPMVVSKEMQKYFNFYNNLEIEIKSNGLEAAFSEAYMRKKKANLEAYLISKDKEPLVSAKKLEAFLFEGEKAFRINLVQQVENVSYRGLHRLLSSNIFLQNFCLLTNINKIVIPGKSLLQKYSTFLSEEELSTIFTKGVQNLFVDSSSKPGDLYADTTCIGANMHYPIDWLFILDGVRTMLNAVTLIRNTGLKNRMECPDNFLTKMNKLSIEMSGATRTKDAKRKRKNALRKMKKLEKSVREHAQKHLDLFVCFWEKTEYKENQARQIIHRLFTIIEKMPTIIWQAHERIIGERLVKNEAKILSLYQDDVHVLVRKKIGAQREFGNQLLIVEQADGFIVDYKFNKEIVEHDSKMVPGIIKRFNENLPNETLESLCGDRGFSSPMNSIILAKNNIFNAICPKSIPEMIERLKEEKFRTKIKRRGPNEGRIAIFKSKFSNTALRSKGYSNRHKAILWGLISHNLFVQINALATQELQQAA